jgi:hypothetical protein
MADEVEATEEGTEVAYLRHCSTIGLDGMKKIMKIRIDDVEIRTCSVSNIRWLSELVCTKERDAVKIP